jgi:hypothetical protein
MAQQGDTPTTAAAAQAFDSVMEEHDLQNGTSKVGGDGDVVMSDAVPNRHNVCCRPLYSLTPFPLLEAN